MERQKKFEGGVRYTTGVYCLKLKYQNRGNKARNKNSVGEARGKAYELGGGEANPDSKGVK
ncbi:hypothetical protein Tco_0277817, partial [Tanacetum coccineum]